jgi:hypothetical protein
MGVSTGTGFTLPRVRLIDNQGYATHDFVKWLQMIQAKTDQSLSLAGQLVGEFNGQIGDQAQVQNSPSALADMIANLDANGVVLPNGVDFSRSYIGKNLDNVPAGTQYGAVPNYSNNENLVQNPTFLSGTMAGWYAGDGGTAAIVTDTLPTGSSGYCIKLSTTSSFQSLFSNSWGFTPGATYFFSAWVKTGGKASWFWYGGPNNMLQYGLGSPTAWTYISDTWTIYTSNPTTLQGFMQFAHFNAGVSDWIEVWGASCVKLRGMDSEIADGSSYQRPLATALTSGQVDLSKGGVINKHLGNIADGGGRYAALVSNLASLANLPDGGGRYAALVAALATLDNLPDGSTYQRVGGCSGNKANTGSINAGAVNSQIQQQTTNYVNISGNANQQIAAATITPAGGYVKVRLYAQVASTNASASGYNVTLWKGSIGGTSLASFGYGVFAKAGGNQYETVALEGVDASPGTSSVTYYASASTNSGGTASLIPVILIAENAKV